MADVNECPDSSPTKDTVIPTSQPGIFGRIFVQNGIVGYASYHFNSEDDCYISFESPVCDMLSPLDNGEKLPKRKAFTNIAFDIEKLCFTGDIVWSPTSWEKGVVWSYLMNFSADWSSIVSGQIMGFDSFDKVDNVKTFIYGDDFDYKLLEDSSICPICFDIIFASCKLACEHIFCKPCTVMVMTSDHADLCPLCRVPIDISKVKVTSSCKEGVDYETFLLPPLKIVGSVYVQADTVGLASYHFESETDCYISYASPSCSNWPDLDNGERPPVKKPFMNAFINEEERIFKGDIIWYPTSWSGDVVWKYEMHFSEDFKSIPSGTIKVFDAVKNGNMTEELKFSINLIYKRLFHQDIKNVLDEAN